jgi:hypothetical protein
LSPGSGIQDGKNPDPDPGSEMNIPDHIFKSLETIFFNFLGLKILAFFDADSDPGSGIFLTLKRDPGWQNSDPDPV